MMTVSQRKKILDAIKGKRKYRMVNDIGIATADGRLEVWAGPEGFDFHNYERVPATHGKRLTFPQLIATIEQFT